MCMYTNTQTALLQVIQHKAVDSNSVHNHVMFVNSMNCLRCFQKRIYNTKNSSISSTTKHECYEHRRSTAFRAKYERYQSLAFIMRCCCSGQMGRLDHLLFQSIRFSFCQFFRFSDSSNALIRERVILHTQTA